MFPFFCTPHHLCRAVNPQGEGKKRTLRNSGLHGCECVRMADLPAPHLAHSFPRASHMLGSYTTRQQERRDGDTKQAGKGQTTHNGTERQMTTPPPQEQDEQPEIEAEMTPRPEYARPDYKAAGKLTGKVALFRVVTAASADRCLALCQGRRGCGDCVPERARGRQRRRNWCRMKAGAASRLLATFRSPRFARTR